MSDDENEGNQNDLTHRESSESGQSTPDSLSKGDDSNQTIAASSSGAIASGDDFEGSKPYASSSRASMASREVFEDNHPNASSSNSSMGPSKEKDEDRYQGHQNPLKIARERRQTESDELYLQTQKTFQEQIRDILKEENHDVFFMALARINHLLKVDENISDKDKKLLKNVFHTDDVTDDPFSLFRSRFIHPTNLIRGLINEFTTSFYKENDEFNADAFKKFLGQELTIRIEQLNRLLERIDSESIKKELENLKAPYFAGHAAVLGSESQTKKSIIQEFPLLNIVFDTQTNTYYRVSDDMVSRMTATDRHTGKPKKPSGGFEGTHHVERFDAGQSSIFTKLGTESEPVDIGGEQSINLLAMQIAGTRQPLVAAEGMSLLISQQVIESGSTYLIAKPYFSQYSQGIDRGLDILQFAQMHAATWLLANQYPDFQSVLDKSNDKIIDEKALTHLIEQFQNATQPPIIASNETKSQIFDILKALNLEEKDEKRAFGDLKYFKFSLRELEIGVQWYQANENQPPKVSPLMLSFLGRFILKADEFYQMLPKDTDYLEFVKALAQDFSAFIDDKSLADLIVLESVSHPGDGKDDNYMLEPIVNEGSFKLRVVGIDNDLRVPTEVVKSQDGYLLGHRSVLPFLVSKDAKIPQQLVHRIVDTKYPENMMLGWINRLYTKDRKIASGVAAGVISTQMLKTTRIQPRVDFNLLRIYYSNLHRARQALAAGNTSIMAFIQATTPNFHNAYQSVIQDFTSQNDEFLLPPITKDIFCYDIEKPLLVQDAPIFDPEYQDTVDNHLMLSPQQAMSYLLLNIDLSNYLLEEKKSREFNGKVQTFSVSAVVVQKLLFDISRFDLPVPGIKLDEKLATEVLSLELLLAAQREPPSLNKRAIGILYHSGASIDEGLKLLKDTFPDSPINDAVMSLQEALQNSPQKHFNQLSILLRRNLGKLYELRLSTQTTPSINIDVASKDTMFHIACVLKENIKDESCTKEQALLDLICETYSFSHDSLTPLNDSHINVQNDSISAAIVDHCLLAQQRNHLRLSHPQQCVICKTSQIKENLSQQKAIATPGSSSTTASNSSLPADKKTSTKPSKAKKTNPAKKADPYPSETNEKNAGSSSKGKTKKKGKRRNNKIGAFFSSDRKKNTKNTKNPSNDGANSSQPSNLG